MADRQDEVTENSTRERNNISIDNQNPVSIEDEVSTENILQSTSQENSDTYNATKSELKEIGNNEYDKNIHYEDNIAIYTDSNTGYQYQWDSDKSEWIPRNNVTYGFEDDTHVYTDKDGIKYFWDKEKRAWFPKIDEEFMARYQMNYGFTDETKTDSINTTSEDTLTLLDEKAKIKGEKRKASEPTWFEVNESENTNVYVSNLPLDIEEQEFIDLMQKCGLVMRDPTTGIFKVKLYKEPNTDYLKGDGLCTYIKIESVALALNLIDGYNYKGYKLKVERAKFQLKGEYDPKLKPKMKKRKDKQKLKKQQEKLFDWRPEKKIGDRAKHEKVVIVKNLFNPNIFDEDVGLILEFQQDLREEAGKLGEVRKIIIYDRHPEGVAQITMSNPDEADQVVTMLNGRWFMKRQLTAAIWDGKTKFKIAETDSQINQRLEGWDKFLDGEENSANISDNTKTISSGN